MNEFFRRADIAENEMQTIDEKEGAKTDRGKIYLLNGKADIVDRKTLADKTTEKWTYKKLKKEYYFENYFKRRISIKENQRYKIINERVLNLDSFFIYVQMIRNQR